MNVFNAPNKTAAQALRTSCRSSTRSSRPGDGRRASARRSPPMTILSPPRRRREPPRGVDAAAPSRPRPAGRGSSSRRRCVGLGDPVGRARSSPRFGISLTKWDLLTTAAVGRAGQLRQLLVQTSGSSSPSATPAFYTVGLGAPRDDPRAGAGPGAQPGPPRDRLDPDRVLPAGRHLGDRGRPGLGLDLRALPGGILNQLIEHLRPAAPEVDRATRSGRCRPIIMMSVWQGLGTSVIIFLAGLQAIPQEYYDAASVDGAGPLVALAQRARCRSSRPSIFFTGILSLIGAFQVFDQVYVLARPGQADRGHRDPRLLHLRERLQELQDGLRRRRLVDPLPHRGGPDLLLLPVAAALGALPVRAVR
ncbi:MAG: sugar ABC transporter permease [Rhodopseudomonas palustris]|nr:sugar ABC transporter permease [Rhodopseudomonas palustris]